MTSLPPEIARARALLRDVAPPQGSKQRVYARVVSRPSPRQSLQARLAIIAAGVCLSASAMALGYRWVVNGRPRPALELTVPEPGQPAASVPRKYKSAEANGAAATSPSVIQARDDELQTTAASQAEPAPIATNAAEPLRPLSSSASSARSSLARPDALESASALSQQVADYRDAVSHLRDNPAIALSALQAHRSKWPNSAIAHEVDLHIIEALVALGRHADAVTAARRFLQRYPESARANEIRRIADANPSVGTIVD